jgi:hypothetical protein
MLLTLLALAVACSSSKESAEEARSPSGMWSHSPPVCGRDEVREYQCEELLSIAPAKPAAPPYESCPMNLEGAVGVHAPAPPVAIFDDDYTAFIRRRAPPGHSCCYSWCSKIRVPAPEQVSQAAGCNGGHQMREQYCFDELEGGTATPAPQPFQRCPSAVVPPASVAFSVPPAAPFDATATATRRSQGFKECCYGWCSAAPAESIQRPRSR